MDLTYAPPSSLRVRPSGATRYVGALGVCLLGYGLFGRPFAYVGVPPVFIGEIMLVIGVVLAARVGRVGEALSSWPLRLWAVLLVWVAVRTAPFLGRDGIDAARDAMQVGYGIYAVVLASLLLAEPDRLRELAAKYWTFALVMLWTAWVVYGLAKTLGEMKPTLPWAPDVTVFNGKGGDLMVQLTGVVAYMMVSARRLTVAQIVLAVFTVLIVMVSNRGGMVAFTLGMGAVWLMRPAGTGGSRFVYTLAALMMLALLIGPLVQVKIQGGTRDLSVEQVVENVTSIFVSSGEGNLDGTKKWRLLWWGEIIDYTFGGPHFWTGKGFGVNLADADGFAVDEEGSLRSPHNGHLTILARAGVPGFLLWLALHLSWVGAILGAWVSARARDQRRWMALFAWLVGFWVAAMVNASFDVYLEGPMGGVWVWSVIGVGVAAVRLFRTHPDLLDALDIPLPIAPHAPNRSASAQPFSWS